MIKTYSEVVRFLESLQMMPKSMPGLQKVTKALEQTPWFAGIDPNKVIVVAGTNGKGTTCAALQALLIEAGQRVGFYSSPHLVSTTERIRINGRPVSEAEFVRLFEVCESLIKSCELSHFEALTLMAGQAFFGGSEALDFIIFEVGLGGTFDATNAFKHKYSAITKLGYDHMSILGTTLPEIASNKFGIVTHKGIVVHQPLSDELRLLKLQVQKMTNSNWVEIEKSELIIKREPVVPSPCNQKSVAGQTFSALEPRYFIRYEGEEFEINIPGQRAHENIMTAVTLFQILGFDLRSHAKALNRIQWEGRMQKVTTRDLRCPVYLSGDHNLQGVQSLIQIVKDFDYKKLHLIVGIGVDKQADEMFNELAQLPNVEFYLTVTPFKGRAIKDYPESIKSVAVYASEDLNSVVQQVALRAEQRDLCIVTGSLYLVGEFLKVIPR